MGTENIILQLQRDILPLQGLKKLSTDNDVEIGFGPIEAAFPNASFPAGCIHEFLTPPEDIAPTSGFIAVLLSKLMQFDGAVIWISASRTLFPPTLKRFGVNPDKIIFIDLPNKRKLLYVIEEALKCKRIAAVVGEVKDITFKESRRLQLAAEQSRVTAFVIRHQTPISSTIACISRWHITSLASELQDGMPGVGFPRWNVELLKVRNGKPGVWQLEYASNHLKEVKQAIGVMQEERRKTG
ncbi:MAG: Error-prone repair protein ImuA [Niabella sp.]